MPDPALPFPAPTHILPNFRRAFRDPMGQPMTGQISLRPVEASTVGGVVYPAAEVTVELVDGVAVAALTKGEYRLTGTLRTSSGQPVVYSETITV